MDGRAESIYEGLLRVLHVVCRIPVEPQVELFDRSGLFVARADLLLSGTRTLHELDGGHHRTPQQQQLDLRRGRRLVGAAYTRRGYTSHDVLTRGADIVRDAAATLAREHDPALVAGWYALLKDSLFTPSGQRRLALRLGLPTENADEMDG